MNLDSSGRNDSITRTKDLSVLQLLTRLVVETEKLIRLADDLNQYGTTRQARSTMNFIGSEVSSILKIIKLSIEPLYKLYEIDPGMKACKTNRDSPTNGNSGLTGQASIDDYDETALWTDVKNNAGSNEESGST